MATMLCPECGVVRTDPYLDEPALRHFYSHEYRNLYDGPTPDMEQIGGWQVKVGRRIIRWARRAGAPIRGVAFEVGCGAGGILVAFQQAGYAVHGCDYGERYVEHGRRRFGLDLHVGGPDSLGALATKADILIVNHVLEHMRDPVAALQHMKTLVRPGGWLFIGVPGILSLSQYQFDFLSFLQNAHVYHYSQDTLARTVERAGWTVQASDESLRLLARSQIPEHVRPLHPGHADTVLSYVRRAERLHKWPGLPRAAKWGQAAWGRLTSW